MKYLATVLMLAGLAPVCRAADMESARATQLPPIDAGTILNQIQNQHNNFPQPAPTTLDLCVFTEFKNNKCLFKCQSGAILTEPAVKPDFSSGEPAGACATHILRPIPATVWPKNKNISSSQLQDLLQDPNPEIRKAAVKSSRAYIQNSFAHDRVVDMLKNKNERTDIRVEAARVLSYAAGNSRIQEALKDVIDYGSEPRELRVMAYKALWTAADTSSRFQDFLMDAVRSGEKDRDARRAAIWALFAAVENTRPQEVLTDLLRFGNEEESTRIEAIKSLYGAMGNPRVKDQLIDIVRNANERKPVRLAALKALSGATGDSRVQSFLEDMMRGERDTELRAGAIAAASPDMADIRDYFHLGYKLQNGAFVSPIENE